MTDSCSTCRFWLNTPDHEQLLGDCRRYAPSPVTAPVDLIGKEMNTFWPVTAHNDLCGDHSASPLTAS